ncbi:MAG: MBL fold metallo-hydrolase [Candidatus Dormibacteraeota bacterium]|uniref:MBL fold metallo-hydrolase n=1 Tax=Candidatus Dormiibacter inghamiae TaxID=3127013 RepID=A0A934KD00_9BACT|nr:MBL fold metallo-hydrolase [Candidatus Dormibacteraeota bacterium]MBJ7607647.1 MBL fold metallo-hydrolase [Candidatus Dormibacteraeota bacterium]
MARLGILKVQGEKEVNCFILTCTTTSESVVIDPVEPAEKVLQQVAGQKVRWVLATHGHAGHVAGKSALQEATGAQAGMHIADAKAFLRSADRYLSDGDELEFGRFQLRVLHTAGHTPGSLCFSVGNHLFTGDTLLAGGIGAQRPETDLRQQLFSIHSRVAGLPLNTAIYPGHGPVTNLEAELRSNPVFQTVRG